MKYTIIIFFLLGIYQLSAQGSDFVHEYTYDAAGNRVQRMEVEEMNITNNEAEGRSVEQLLGVSIFPNPADDQVNISMDSELVNAYLVLYNATGQAIKQEPITATVHELDMKPLPSGIYFIQLHADDKISKWKIIKR